MQMIDNPLAADSDKCTIKDRTSSAQLNVGAKSSKTIFPNRREVCEAHESAKIERVKDSKLWTAKYLIVYILQLSLTWFVCLNKMGSVGLNVRGVLGVTSTVIMTPIMGSGRLSNCVKMVGVISIGMLSAAMGIYTERERQMEEYDKAVEYARVEDANTDEYVEEPDISLYVTDTGLMVGEAVCVGSLLILGAYKQMCDGVCAYNSHKCHMDGDRSWLKVRMFFLMEVAVRTLVLFATSVVLSSAAISSFDALTELLSLELVLSLDDWL